MAGPSHLAILEEGVKAWNEWRAQNPLTTPDFTEADLQKADLPGVDLQGADLEGAILEGANLEGANLEGAILRRTNLRDADLQEAILRRANLLGTNLQGANLRGTNFEEADLQGVDLQGANLQGANLQGANLRGARNLTQEQIERAFGDETTTLPEPLNLPGSWRLAAKAGAARAGNLGGAANDTVERVKDQLGFVHYVKAFAELIDSPDTDPPLTIGIYGSWGMGKSFLLKNIESKLQDETFRNRQPGAARRPTVHVVHFNAWEYNAAEVIWPGLVRKILNTLEQTWSRRRRFATKFWRNARRQTRQFRGRLLLVALVLAAVFLVTLWQSGNDATTFTEGAIAVGGALTVVGVGGLVKLVSDTLANPLGQYVTALAEDSDYGRDIGYMTEIRQDLEKLQKRLSDENGRILVVVDDLDRCEPEKAVEVLQAINLLLNFESFIVCLGIDARIITSAVNKHYEELLGDVGASGYEYLEKIIQIPFRIPQPSEEEIKTFLSEQMRNPEEPSSTDGEAVPDDSRGEGDSLEGPDRELPSERRSPSPEHSRTDARIAFTSDERKGFRDVAPFLRPNPRHLKRLVNVYRLVRTLADAKGDYAILEKPSAIIRWLVICAQWPYTSHAMLWQYAQKLEEWNRQIPPAAPPAGAPLLYLLNEVDPRLSRDKQDELDEDPESLRELLELKGERLTWEELRRIRHYTINFNPAVEGEMGALKEEEQPVDSTGDGPSDISTSQAQAKDAPA